jgi:hypothetical protein
MRCSQSRSAGFPLLARRKWWNENEGGYEHLHCTKPQTLAYALTDSPVGLAGWILENDVYLVRLRREDRVSFL